MLTIHTYVTISVKTNEKVQRHCNYKRVQKCREFVIISVNANSDNATNIRS